MSLHIQSKILIVAAYLVLYVLLDWVSFVDPYGPLGITPWNPPPALSILLVIHYGPWMMPWVWVAAVAADFIVRDIAAPWGIQIVACAVLASGYTGAASFLKQRLQAHVALTTLRDATLFAVTAVVGTLVIGAAYVGVYVAANTLSSTAFVPAVAQFWIGDVIGIVVTFPLLLVLTRLSARRYSDRIAETLLQAVSIGAALYIVFGVGLGAQLKLFYILFLPLIWIAMRRGSTGSAVASFVVQVGIIAALMLGGHAPGEVLDFQFLMLFLALTGLFLGVTVEERRSAEHKLRDKQFELDRSLRAAAASELASALAHELNQPLSAVASYTRACQLLIERGDPSNELPSIMAKLVGEANRAGVVVHRLREFVRSGSMDQQQLAPATLLSQVREAAAPRFTRHAVALTMDVAPNLPDVIGDRVQLETVLHNLIGNAIDALKNATGERCVVLTAERHDADHVRLCVTDNGPGLAADARQSLFQPFATHKSEGLGLGLAISRTIVEAHGGSLWLADGQKGASFCLTLPVWAPQ